MAEIIFAEDENEEIDELVGKGFEAHSAEHGLSSAYRPFTFIARENGVTVGAALGNVYYKEIHVSELLVDREHRGKNIGSELMQAVEEHYRGKGYEFISLSTHRFQAPDFYKKLGFETEFIRKSPSEPKLDKYYMVKHLK